jgi:shikimate kinase
MGTTPWTYALHRHAILSRIKMCAVADVVVLLGAPGSGKTAVGEELARRGLRWWEWELWILARWGSRDAFVARKAEALPALHGAIRAWTAEGGPTAAIETTGLSDAAFLDALGREHRCLVVRLDVAEDEALRRVATRDRDRHLSDEVAANRAVWRAFDQMVVPRRPVDLVIDTARLSPAHTAALVAGVTRRRVAR